MSCLVACVQSQPTGWADAQSAQEGWVCKVGSGVCSCLWLCLCVGLCFVCVLVFVVGFVCSGLSLCLVATHAHENCGCDWVWRRGPGKLAAFVFVFVCLTGYAGACPGLPPGRLLWMPPGSESRLRAGTTTTTTRYMVPGTKNQVPVPGTRY